MKNISIILIKPQMGENIGATARSMKNFGITDLRIVSPRDGWPNAKAHEMAASADDIIENAKLFDSTEEAVADLNLVFATASKPRDMVKDIITPEQAAQKLNSQLSSLTPQKVGILFGKESSGLDNEDISHATALVSIPVSPDYDSLNLAQAVCIMCYEIYKTSCHPERSEGSHLKEILRSAQNDNLSERKDLNELIKFLEAELECKNFFQVPEKKPGMLVNIRNIFTKNLYTEQEVRTLRGIFNALRK